MQATITFKTKASTPVNGYRILSVPKFERRHCNMEAWRRHKRFGSLANSNLFSNVLSRVRSDIAPAGILRTDRLPANVSIDVSGFLAVVTVIVE